MEGRKGKDAEDNGEQGKEKAAQRHARTLGFHFFRLFLRENSHRFSDKEHSFKGVFGVGGHGSLRMWREMVLHADLM